MSRGKILGVLGALIVAAGVGGAGVYLFTRKAQVVTEPTSHLEPRSLASEATIGDFTLIDHRGNIERLYGQKDAKFVVITAHGNGCPIIQKFTIKINELNSKYTPKGVRFFMLNANTEDDRKSVMKEAEEYGVKTPILLDPSQVVAKGLGFSRTSETIIIDTKTWKIVYRGPINDQLDYGVDKQNARNEYLEAALDAALAGKKIPTDVPAAKGCLISYPAQKEISYKDQVAPVIEKKCLRCHFPPTKFPPSFNSIANLRSWAAMIRETVVTERMPPFSADPLYGPYGNDISLTPQEKWLLVEWIDQGMPDDHTGVDPVSVYKRPPNHVYKRIKGKKPIYVAKMEKPADIPPGGEVEYKYFQLGGPIPEDMWISEMNVLSSNPRQVHHASLMITSKPLKWYEDMVAEDRDEKAIASNKTGDIPIFTLWKMNQERVKDIQFNRVQIWAAGRNQPFTFGKKAALLLPKGYYLTLETHYMGTGKPDSEQMTLEFYGTKNRGGRKRVKTLMLADTEFEVPPGAKRYVVVTKPYRIRRDLEIRSLLGHMHMRGKAIRAILRTPDGKERTIASIPNFYYGWQTGGGILPNPPIFVAEGSELIGECEYDNSAENPNNPDPSKVVKFGQTHDRTEMCHFNLQLIVDD